MQLVPGQGGVQIGAWVIDNDSSILTFSYSSDPIMELNPNTGTATVAGLSSANGIVITNEGLQLAGAGTGITFSDGSVQTTAAGSHQGVPNLKVFNANGTYQWTVPANVTNIMVEVWGAGGGGGGGTAYYSGYYYPGGGAGGGGGGYGRGVFTVTPGSQYTVTVGAGGQGGPNGGIGPAGSSGFNGGGSSLGNLISAGGGSGGSGGSYTSPTGYLYGGAGGSGGTGIDQGIGENGRAAQANFSTAGDGGGSPRGGLDAHAILGNVNNKIGIPGDSPGGGGSGGGVDSAAPYTNTPRDGGSGADGQVIIFY